MIKNHLCDDDGGRNFLSLNPFSFPNPSKLTLNPKPPAAGFSKKKTSFLPISFSVPSKIQF